MDEEKSRSSKNRIRYNTYVFIKRHCDLEMICQICKEKAQIHHLDYNDRYKINLLCRKHHLEVHTNKIKHPEIIDIRDNVIKNYSTENNDKALYNLILSTIEEYAQKNFIKRFKSITKFDLPLYFRDKENNITKIDYVRNGISIIPMGKEV